MGRVIINGTLLPVQQPDEMDFDPVRGLILTKEFHSAGDNLITTANFYLNTKVAYHWKRSPVVSKLVATISGGQDGLPDIAQPNWQLLCNEMQKDLLASPYALSSIVTYPDLIAHVIAGVILLQNDVNNTTTTEPPYYAALSAGEQPIYYYFTRKIFSGQKSYAIGQYVLRRTFSISNFYAGTVQGDSLAEMVLPMSTILTFDMPAPIKFKLASIPVPFGSYTNYYWGWRQLPSQMTTSAQNRVEVSTEWWLDAWDTYLYPVYTFLPLP